MAPESGIPEYECHLRASSRRLSQASETQCPHLSLGGSNRAHLLELLRHINKIMGSLWQRLGIGPGLGQERAQRPQLPPPRWKLMREKTRPSSLLNLGAPDPSPRPPLRLPGEVISSLAGLALTGRQAGSTSVKGRGGQVSGGSCWNPSPRFLPTLHLPLAPGWPPPCHHPSLRC